MKINVRLLLITFTIIVIISLSSTFIFYSTTTSLLKNQYSKVIINSKTDFNLAFQNLIGSLDSELYELTETKNISTSTLNDLDFIFSIDNNRKIIQNKSLFSENINRAFFSDSFDEFLSNYPNIILKYYQNNEKESYFYGKVLNEELLNKLSEKIRSEVVLLIKKTPFMASNIFQNEIYFTIIFEAANKKMPKLNSNVFYKELENGDFFADIFVPEYLIVNDPIQFLIFNVPTDLDEFRDKIQSITLTIAFTGILLSLIFVLLFTTKIRRQISLLSDATQITAKGDLSHRVSIISNDELGNLGKIFNNMLDHIQSNEKSEREYSELITIINKTPNLKELLDTVLEKIIKTTSISFGVFYLVENKNIKPISTHGISHSVLKAQDTNSFYSDVISNKKLVELTFDENYPIIKTGLTEIEIKYLLIMPIIFNKTVIGVIELASEHKPIKSPVHYLNKIKNQLAIGLNSSLSYEQLENLVSELKTLNEEYQKQNFQISEKNAELINLHGELKKQTTELEEQRKKAIELTHVKSQFLANMSHELRTPLNSIIGLTELISEDASTYTKTKDRLKIVLRNSNKLLAMINNILEFSKIESGKFELNKANFVFSEFLHDIFNSFEPLVTEKGLKFEINFDSNYDLLLNTDRHKIEQVVLNLLGNALKFTEVGGIKVKVVLVNNISLKIDVVDTGIGITEDDKERIFKEFEQVDFTTSRKYQGAGLGLAICKKYLEQLGGQISVLSNQVRGASFSVFLNNVVLERFLITDSLILRNKIANSEHEIKRIAVLHKQERLNNEISSYFEKNNYDIITCQANVEDLSQLENRILDGIIFELNYNLISDWNILLNIKQNVNMREIPLVILTQNTNDNLFSPTNIFDFITDANNLTCLQKRVELISLQFDEVKSIHIISNSQTEFTNNLKELNNKFSITFSDVDNLSDFEMSSKVNFVIVDVHLLTYQIYSKLKAINIPILIFINTNIINENMPIITNNWSKLIDEFSNSKEDTYKQINQKISLLKKIKTSILPILETSEEINLANDKSSFKVLVVDDDSDTLFTVGEILQNIGCKILYANNGAECLTALKESTPDLVLLDIMMPVMDGFETIKRIRANEETKNIMVYAITAQAMLDDIFIIKNNGFDDLITKPVNATTLAFKIKQAMDK